MVVQTSLYPCAWLHGRHKRLARRISRGHTSMRLSLRLQYVTRCYKQHGNRQILAIITSHLSWCLPKYVFAIATR